jgi:acyl carrier protein
MASEKQGSENSVFEQLCDVIANIIGADAAEIIDIQPSSKFVRDLGMDSIQIVMLVEQGNALYGGQVDFATWLKDMSFRALLKLTVGDVVDFIETSLRAKGESKQ